MARFSLTARLNYDTIVHFLYCGINLYWSLFSISLSAKSISILNRFSIVFLYRFSIPMLPKSPAGHASRATVSTFSSVGTETSLVKATKVLKMKWLQIALLIVSICVPAGMLAMVGYFEVVEYISVTSVATSFEKTGDIGRFLGAMQTERDYGCMLVSQKRGNAEDKRKLIQRYFRSKADTDKQFEEVQLLRLPIDAHDFINNILPPDLQILREKIINNTVTRKNITVWFNEVTKRLNKMLAVARTSTFEGSLYSKYFAHDSWMYGTDNYERVAGLGALYYYNGFLRNQLYHRYCENFGSAKVLLTGYADQFVWKTNDSHRLFIETALNGREDLIAIERNVTVTPSFKTAFKFYKNMTKFTKKLLRTRQEMQGVIRGLVVRQENKIYNKFMLTGLCAAFVLFLSPPLTIYYVYQNNRLSNRSKTYLERLKDQQKEMNEEKQRAEHLLLRMMPRSVIESLKTSGTVPPETFESASVYFSDIVGFTTLAGNSSVVEIVTLLSQLYSMFDSITDRHDVYKVETIGDAYMLASGIPIRNNMLHASVIATIALDLLQAVSGWAIPHIRNENLLMRAGIHTGPCVAAVVGMKMPRYCIFGETVVVASMMESTGYPGRCHVSPEMKKLLASFREFVVVPREEVVPSNPLLMTYWLLSKNGHNFKIDLKKTEEKFNKTQYWRK